ncbi:hypothetical protein BD560DRAFT_455031 [Blakeslea trispora]|nr:hypothetical protein BD560DRAFT_455031 [Blakeslea trispora]
MTTVKNPEISNFMNFYGYDEFNQEEEDSDYSIDYEYLGPRKPNYRDNKDTDSIASELSDASDEDGFDMWDEDPYSTNDFTWESNDMRLTSFIKRRQKELIKVKNAAPWQQSSFWKKEKGWPRQLPASNSTTNHDQSANALTLVLSDYGTYEKLLAVYRDRIIECGHHVNETVTSIANTITWLESQKSQLMSTLVQSCDKFVETHASVSISKVSQSNMSLKKLTADSNIETDLYQPTLSSMTNTSIYNPYIPTTSVNNPHVLSKLVPYTKYVERSQYPAPQNAYLALEFEPLCLAEKYGYMAIGGIEGDDACLFHIAVSSDNNRLVFGTPVRLDISRDVLAHSYKPSPTNALPPSTYSSQYVAWSASSLYFAHTSDTHSHVFVWRMQPQIEMIYRIDAAGYTYAIQFHPELEGVLVFSNRYGYIHTVNLDECMTQEGVSVKLINYNSECTKSNKENWLRPMEQSEHQCAPLCLKGTETVCHTNHLAVRHEITMISFRGEKNKQLRILAKINGLQWSRDGTFLYVSTKKRVLAYKFISGQIQSLKKIATQAALAMIEKGSVAGKRKRDQVSVQQAWSKKWNDLPPHLQSSILDNTRFASHW